MVVIENSIPVVYDDWTAWRDERARTETSSPITGTFCGLCWGNGRILEPAANGEGLIPVTCEACGGMRISA